MGENTVLWEVYVEKCIVHIVVIDIGYNRVRKITSTPDQKSITKALRMLSREGLSTVVKGISTSLEGSSGIDLY